MVELFRKQVDRIVTRRRSPKAFAWERDLYRTQIPDASDPVKFESAMSVIEGSGLKVRDTIISTGINGLSNGERWDFSMFLALLMTRRPEYVTPKMAPAQEDWERRVIELFADAIAAGNIDEATIRGKVEGHGSEITLRAMMQVAESWAGEINKLDWRIFDVSSGNLPLVVSDHPFIMGRKGSEKLTKIEIPLTPYFLFVGGEGPSWTEIAYREEFRQPLAIQSLSEQFGNAENFVVALDRGKNDAYVAVAKGAWGRRRKEK